VYTCYDEGTLKAYFDLNVESRFVFKQWLINRFVCCIFWIYSHLSVKARYCLVFVT